MGVHNFEGIMYSGGTGVHNSGPIPNTHRLTRIAIPHHGAGDLYDAVELRVRYLR